MIRKHKLLAAGVAAAALSAPALAFAGAPILLNSPTNGDKLLAQEAQNGRGPPAQGLWTHTPVDWAGNEGIARAVGWPNNAKDGYLGQGTGTRPGGAATQAGPSGSPTIVNVSVGSITTTSAVVR